jgi:hypothetical protein
MYQIVLEDKRDCNKTIYRNTRQKGTRIKGRSTKIFRQRESIV